MAAFQRIQQIAAQRYVHAALHWLHLHEPQLRRWQMEMVAIPAPQFAESTRAAWLLQRFAELNLANPRIDSEGNVLAELPSTSAQTESAPQTVLLSAHIDTVFPPGTDCTPREDKSRLYAPGICDNAAGVVALLAIAGALTAAGIRTLPRPLLFAGNVGEEGEGNLRGMRHLFQNGHGIVAALALDGSGNDVIAQALGSRRFRVNITGPGGHSWSDAGLPNPAYALARALVAISEAELPITPRTTLNIGTLAAGTSVNSIPQSATAQIDFRSTDAAQLDRLQQLLFAAVDSAVTAVNQRAAAIGRVERLTSAIDLIGDRPSAALPADSPLLETIRAVDRHLNISTVLRLASTDANIPLALGIPAVALGAGGTSFGAHTTAEWYAPEGRDLSLRRILLTVLDLCMNQ